MMRHLTTTLALAAAVVVAAGCSGGGGSTSLPAPAASSASSSNAGTATQSQPEAAISAANSLGNSMKAQSSYNSTLSPQALARSPQSITLNTCQSGFEFFAPDKNNDPNSTEAQYFYDTACTQLARDITRLYQSTGSSSETIVWTEKDYSSGSSSVNATRTDSVTLTNASFDQYGFPIAASGFDRVATGNLSLAGARTIDSDYELVVLPGTNGVNTYCGDSAGYNDSGIASLNETFGWAGGSQSPGTRTVNADGSVTWNVTSTGTSYKGTIGALAIVAGTQNASCPIATPMFTLSGGISLGTYTIPLSATYKNGELTNLVITGAALANGNTLSVTTNGGLTPPAAGFITGSVSGSSGQIATFSVNAFGDGTLTVASSGTQYAMTDWHVVK